MPLSVIIGTELAKASRGWLKGWFIEIEANVYIGNLPHAKTKEIILRAIDTWKIREIIWIKIKNTQQDYEIEILKGTPNRTVVLVSGLQLIERKIIRRKDKKTTENISEQTQSFTTISNPAT